MSMPNDIMVGVPFQIEKSGRCAWWEIVNIKMLPKPIPAKGMQGLWNWNGFVA